MDLFPFAQYWSAAAPAARPPARHKILERFEDADLEKMAWNKEVKVVRTGCFGLCEAGPVVHRVSRGRVLQPRQGGGRR